MIGRGARIGMLASIAAASMAQAQTPPAQELSRVVRRMHEIAVAPVAAA